MSENKKEYFTSRWGFILSMMGVAVGAGNIWRFSRVVAQNGGGSFIIPWVIFLFVWSIPLIIAEIAMGKLTRKAPIGALALVGGKNFGWMGAFIAMVATGILFYYSVVVGWGISYFYFSLRGLMTSETDFFALWHNYENSLLPLFFHALSMTLGVFIVFKGITRGIERSNKILMPLLFVMIIIIAIRAITLPNASQGINFLFTPDFATLTNYKVWLEALTQNAWDTGAGWGLLLVYACYAHKKESITVNSCITAFGNNAISLIFGIIIFSSVFALQGAGGGVEELIKGEGSTNTGLTFIFLPKLFTQLPGGFSVHLLFSSIFFLSFSFAALSSMTSMVQLTSQVIHELGMKRKNAILLTGVAGFLLGIPSALNMKFFDNQDWVWGVGLIVSGLFMALAIIRYGADKYRTSAINTSPHDFKLGKFYNIFIVALIPIQAITLIVWFFYQSITGCSAGRWWDPFLSCSAGTIVMQWGIAMITFILLNKWLVRKTLTNTSR